jgi:acetoin utilization protein AcuB
MDGPRLAGIISERDLFRASLASVIDYGRRMKRDYLKTVVIKEVMTSDLITIGPEATITEAGQLMLKHKIGCLPVISGERMVGLVTETDVLHHFVEGDRS